MSIHDYIEKRRALAEAAELAGIFFAALSELRGNDHVDEEAITHIAASGPETTLAELRVVEAAATALNALDHVGCPNPDCDGGSIPVAIGEHYVTREMALDAGEPDMEGQSMGVEWEQEQCQWCDERRAALEAAESPIPAEVK